MKRIILGTGTGRCGTRSLAELLGLQEGCVASHERFSGMDREKPLTEYLEKLAVVRAEVVADVSPGWLAHISYDYLFEIANRLEVDLKVVVLQRPLEQYLLSCLRHSRHAGSGLRNMCYLTDPEGHEEPYAAHPRPYRRPDFGWDKTFPKWDEISWAPPEVLFTCWWWEAKGRANMLARQEPERVLWGPTDFLNTPVSVRALLDWCGFENPVIPDQAVHMNRS